MKLRPKKPEAAPEWLPVASVPRNACNLAVRAEITCRCARGSVIVLIGHRIDGQWMFADFEHDFKPTDYYQLPPPPGWGH